MASSGWTAGRSEKSEDSGTSVTSTSSAPLLPFARGLDHLQRTAQRQRLNQLRKMQQMQNQHEAQSQTAAQLSAKLARQDAKTLSQREHQRRLASSQAAEAAALKARREAVRQRAEEVQARREAELAAKEAAARKALQVAAAQKLRDEAARQRHYAEREVAAAAALRRKEEEQEQERRRVAARVQGKEQRTAEIAAARTALMKQIKDTQKRQILEQDRMREALHRMQVTGKAEVPPLEPLPVKQQAAPPASALHRWPLHTVQPMPAPVSSSARKAQASPPDSLEYFLEGSENDAAAERIAAWIPTAHNSRRCT